MEKKYYKFLVEVNWGTDLRPPFKMHFSSAEVKYSYYNTYDEKSICIREKHANAYCGTKTAIVEIVASSNKEAIKMAQEIEPDWPILVDIVPGSGKWD